MAVIVVLVICTDGAPTESRLYGFHGHTRAHLLCATCCVRFRWVAGSVGRFFPEFLAVRRALLFLVIVWYRGVCLPGVSEIQVIFGRLLCVRILLWRTIVDDLEKHASRACLWRWADDPGGSVMGTGSSGSFLSRAGAL